MAVRRLKVRFTSDAIADLEEIYSVVFQISQNRRIARSYINRIMQSAKRIGDAPHGYRLRDDLRKGLRLVAFEKRAIIAYEISETVDILNVFYGGRDYEAIYRGEKRSD